MAYVTSRANGSACCPAQTFNDGRVTVSRTTSWRRSGEMRRAAYFPNLNDTLGRAMFWADNVRLTRSGQIWQSRTCDLPINHGAAIAAAIAHCGFNNRCKAVTVTGPVPPLFRFSRGEARPLNVGRRPMPSRWPGSQKSTQCGGNNGKGHKSDNGDEAPDVSDRDSGQPGRDDHHDPGGRCAGRRLSGSLDHGGRHVFRRRRHRYGDAQACR